VIVLASDGAPVRSPWPDVPVRDVDRTLGHAAAAAGVLGTVAAIEWIAAGRYARVLVLSSSADAGCIALVWEVTT
jgi:hypothetical protein